MEDNELDGGRQKSTTKMEQTQNGTPLQELRSRGLTSVGTKLLGPTSTMENIVEKKRVAAIREGIPEEIVGF